MSKAKPRPKPQACRSNAPFWAAAREEKLLLQYHPPTGTWQFWPRPNSVRTGQPDLQWRTSAGRGFVYSYTVSAIAAPGFEDRVPYAIGLIELDEGVRIIANVTGIDPTHVTIGMRVRVVWEELGEGIKFPSFEPEPAAA